VRVAGTELVAATQFRQGCAELTLFFQHLAEVAVGLRVVGRVPDRGGELR
jgi:hypothetical protein